MYVLVLLCVISPIPYPLKTNEIVIYSLSPPTGGQVVNSANAIYFKL